MARLAGRKRRALRAAHARLNNDSNRESIEEFQSHAKRASCALASRLGGLLGLR